MKEGSGGAHTNAITHRKPSDIGVRPTQSISPTGLKELCRLLARVVSVLVRTVRWFGNEAEIFPSQPLLWGVIRVNFKSSLIINEGFANLCGRSAERFLARVELIAEGRGQSIQPSAQ
jgi:hypothetical protein